MSLNIWQFQLSSLQRSEIDPNLNTLIKNVLDWFELVLWEKMKEIEITMQQV